VFVAIRQQSLALTNVNTNAEVRHPRQYRPGERFHVANAFVGAVTDRKLRQQGSGFAFVAQGKPADRTEPAYL
jgi:hypothetical protein